MILESLLLASVLATNPEGSADERFRSDNFTVTIQVPDPNNEGQTIDRQADCYISITSWETDVNTTSVARTVTVTPASSTPRFTLNGRPDATNVTEGSTDGQMFTMRGRFQTEGVPSDILPEMAAFLNEQRNEFHRKATQTSLTYDPDREVSIPADAAGVIAEYGHDSKSLIASVVWVRTYRESSGREITENYALDQGTEIARAWLPHNGTLSEKPIPRSRPIGDAEPGATLWNDYGQVPGLSQIRMRRGSYLLPRYRPESTYSSLLEGIRSETSSFARNSERFEERFSTFRNLIGGDQPWISGTSMNHLRFRNYPPMDCFSTIGRVLLLAPGTILVPSDARYQRMLLIQPIRYTFARAIAEHLSASTNPGFQSQALDQVRVLCANMAKLEPAPGVSYFPASPEDSVLPELAQRMLDSSFRGPWDQARLWIYTDKASLSDINERIAPPVSHGNYIRGLFDVASVGGFDDDDYSNNEIFDEDLLFHLPVSQDASNWFALQLATSEPERYAEALSSNSSEARLLAGTGADEDGIAWAARLADIGLGSDNAGLRDAALTFLNQSVAPVNRAAVVAAGGLRNIGFSLLSRDEDEASKADATARAYGLALD